MFRINTLAILIFILVVASILAVANKNIYGYILRDADNHQLESFDMLAKDGEAGQRSCGKLKNEMKFVTQIWSQFCSHLRLY